MTHYAPSKVIKAPLVSEKSTLLADSQNSFVFKVEKSATKLQVKKAVEKMFNVKVDSVRTLTVKGKTKRTAKGMGKRSDWKKAYVRLQDGQDIDFTTA